LFSFSSLLADFHASNIANALFNGSNIDELPNHVLRFLVDTGPLKSSVNKGRCLASIKGEKLLRILFDFLLGHF
jgi:hypothetical protein